MECIYGWLRSARAKAEPVYFLWFTHASYHHTTILPTKYVGAPPSRPHPPSPPPLPPSSPPLPPPSPPALLLRGVVIWSRRGLCVCVCVSVCLSRSVSRS